MTLFLLYIKSNQMPLKNLLTFIIIIKIFLLAYCPTLPKPLNGDVVISSNGTKSTAEYSCTPGYEVLGEPVLTCLPDGSWDVVEPLCG